MANNHIEWWEQRNETTYTSAHVNSKNIFDLFIRKSRAFYHGKINSKIQTVTVANHHHEEDDETLFSKKHETRHTLNISESRPNMTKKSVLRKLAQFVLGEDYLQEATKNDFNRTIA